MNVINMEITSNCIFVNLITITNTPAPVNDLLLHLDTGAFITLINKDRADEHGYKIFQEKSCAISGFSEKGLICDLRKIPTAIFGGYKLENVIIATPHDRTIKVAEVLGMNILENFNLHLNFDALQLSVNKRLPFTSQKPKYQCGAISKVQEQDTI